MAPAREKGRSVKFAQRTRLVPDTSAMTALSTSVLEFTNTDVPVPLTAVEKPDKQKNQRGAESLTAGLPKSTMPFPLLSHLKDLRSAEFATATDASGHCLAVSFELRVPGIQESQDTIR